MTLLLLTHIRKVTLVTKEYGFIQKGKYKIL